MYTQNIHKYGTRKTCLKEDLHCLGAGILGRFVYGIIAIVTGLTWTCIELGYLEDTTSYSKRRAI